MQESDFKRFHGVMIGMSELHQREMSQFMLDAYWLALRDWDLGDFESAASLLLKTLKWMPKPSDFTDLRKAGEPGPSEAWAMALKGCVEWRNPGRLPNGRIARAADAVGGFRAIAMADLERDMPHIQRRFLQAYEELSDVESVREAVPQIASHGARNALRGPKQVGGFLSALEPPLALEVKRREVTDKVGS